MRSLLSIILCMFCIFGSGGVAGFGGAAAYCASTEGFCADVEGCDSVWIAIDRADSVLIPDSLARLCEGNAVLYARSTSYDAGKVNYKREVKHTFRIYNIGSEPLVIFSLRTGASSMKVKASRKPLSRGEWVEMKVEYEAEKMPLGNFMRNIEVVSNSCGGSITLFMLSGHSTRDYK